MPRESIPAFAANACLALVLLIAGSPLLAQVAPAPSGDASRAAAIFPALDRAGLLDKDWAEPVASLCDDLVGVSGTWDECQVNGPWRPGLVNVYVIRADRPSGNPLAPLDIRLGQVDGGAFAEEPLATIFVDAGMLREFEVATRLRQAGQVEDMLEALALIRTRGLETMYRAAGVADEGAEERVQMLVGGGIAFVIAHELGHIHLGRRTFGSDARRPTTLTGKDRDALSACPAQLDPSFAAKQELERAADDFAADLLMQRCGTWSEGQREHLVYELGTQWYFLYTMNRSLLAVADQTQSPRIHMLLQTQLGPELYRAVVAGSSGDDRGSVAVTYPKHHPPDYERSERVQARMAQSPCSISYGSDTSSPMIQLLEMAREQSCSELATKARP
jgi:hypothetical protein